MIYWIINVINSRTLSYVNLLTEVYVTLMKINLCLQYGKSEKYLSYRREMLATPPFTISWFSRLYHFSLFSSVYGIFTYNQKNCLKKSTVISFFIELSFLIWKLKIMIQSNLIIRNFLVFAQLFTIANLFTIAKFQI